MRWCLRAATSKYTTQALLDTYLCLRVHWGFLYKAPQQQFQRVLVLSRGPTPNSSIVACVGGASQKQQRGNGHLLDVFVCCSPLHVCDLQWKWQNITLEACLDLNPQPHTRKDARSIWSVLANKMQGLQDNYSFKSTIYRDISLYVV